MSMTGRKLRPRFSVIGVFYCILVEEKKKKNSRVPDSYEIPWVT